MSEFSKVMNEWCRMCDYFFDGIEWACNKDCPLYEYKICLEKNPLPLEMTQELSNEIAQTIMIWAKENPEPVYPTFTEWLNSISVTISDRPFPAQNIPVPVFQVNKKCLSPFQKNLLKNLDLNQRPYDKKKKENQNGKYRLYYHTRMLFGIRDMRCYTR